ncbi:hypothetical protein GCM10008018_67130 [Paenibacillus marchantiophytorum]|uniref:SLH domain-containing protein n=1 Tax=Paenibacillus marchantiophytorum TaxID=1619310 RepID=A0ABQ1FHP4_9BACL|nr:cadherin-like beta sandwich domain-containing protein [Paenibacillus marchantiophytorum]GGA12676.1 hypothetical protein GCM10008018_67130 [Paenibacillus marchantiophytorum]
MVHWRDVRSIFRGNRFYARAALLGLLLLVAAGIGAVSVASAATFTVNTTADTVDSNTGDGVCADSNSECSLRAAIMQANALPGADVITIPTGTYTTASAQLEIRGDVTLQGSNSASTIIQAGLNAAASTHRVLEINPDLDNTGYNVTIQGLTIRYGNSTPLSNYGGGGIGGDVGSKTLTITDSIIANNTTAEDGFGGGMYISGTSAGKVKLTNVTITDNTAGAANSANYSSRGGGMYLEGDMALEMSNLTVQNNMSYGLGGGVAIVSASNALRNVTIASSTFSSNKAFSKNGGTEGRAGGLYLGSPAVITNTAFTGNTAGSDGGGLVLDFFAGTVSLTDVEGTGNSAVRGGGMFINANKAPVLTRTNFTGNNSGGNIAVNSEGTDMIVTMAPNGTFSQGKIGAHYTVTVTNNGNVKTNGTVTAVVTLPTGLTASVLAGSGWTCTPATLTCFRSDVLNGKNNYPVIDVTVDVAANTPRSVTSSVSVSGGDELDVSNNTGTHNTTVLSKDATLTGLILSNAALKETFAPETIAYTVDVLYAVNSLKVTPVVNESHATVKVNNTLVTSGQASGSIPLSVGSSNVITVTVTAENSDTKSYTITVNRAPQSSDATLKDLTVDGTTVTDFVPGTVAYTVKVPNEKTAVTVLGTKTDAMAGTPVVVGGSNLAVGNNTVTITVTAENGITKVYTVTVVRAPSSNANLIGLNVDGAPLADFASGTPAYTLNVLYAKSAIAITGIKEDATANAVVAGGSILAVGNNTVTVTVTAEDGTTKKIYTVTVVRADKSTNANLTDLKVDGVSVVGFSSSRLNYTVNVPNTKTSVVVMGTKEDSTAGNPVVVGGSNLLVGDNTVTVTVTAEDGTTKKVYTVIIVRAANSDASLSALEVDGTSVANFDPNTLTYTVNVPNATQSVVVTGTKKETTASDPVVVGGSNLLVGNNTVTVTVTAEDGTTKKIYTVTVVRAASSDASLSDLKVDGTSVANFDPLDLAYTLNVPNSQTSVVVVTTTTDPTALTPVVIGGSNLLVGNNTVTITVTAEDGTTKKVYTLTIVRAASNDAALIGLSVDGTPLTGFASDTFTYTYNVLYAKTSINITGTKAYANASVAVAGGSNLIVGHNTVTVTVTAEDGVTKQDYTVTVVRADKSTNANLNDLKIDGVSVAGFSPSKLTYKVTVPNTTTSVVVVGTKEDSAAGNPVVVGGSNLLVGDNTVTVTVTAEDGTTEKVYTMTVVRAASNDASLSDLKVDGTSVANFDPNTLAYTVNVPNAQTSVAVTATKLDPAAQVQVVGGSNMVVGNSNKVTVTVTAQDGITKKEYIVSVVRAGSSNSSLSSLSVDGKPIAGFASGTLTYTVHVPNAKKFVVVTATKTDPTANVLIVGGSNLDVGNSNTVKVTVTAEDGTSVTSYIITIDRAANDDASLSGLSVDGKPLADFDSGKLHYAVTVTNEVYSVTVSGSVYAPTSQILINNVVGASKVITLQDGLNAVVVKVIAQNLSEQVYSIAITRNTSAELNGFSLSGVTLTPVFAPKTLGYSGTVPNTVQSTTVSASVYDPLASIAVYHNNVLINNVNAPIQLIEGRNTVSIVVTPRIGDVQTYTAVITREGQPSSSGSGGGGPSDPTQVFFRIGDNGTELPIRLERKHAADGRVIDTVAITPEIVQLAGSSGSKGNVLKLKIPQIPEGSDEFNIGFTQEALQALNKGGTAISIEMEAVQMTIPLHTVAKALESKEELLIRFIPISSDAAKQQIEKRVMTAVLVTKAAGSGQVAVVGLPLTIESNITNNEVTLNFSFKGIQIPTDPKKRNEFLASLGIYIEHSDGEKELVKGKINYDTQRNPVSMEIIITKFSTFSMIEIQKKPIDTISYTNWIEGYPDGTFKPNQSITRAEVSSIFVKAIAKPQSLVALQNFKDVADQHWAAGAIHQAQKAEWLSGYPDGSFKPDAPITRGELAAIIVKINKLAVNNDVQAFVDTKNHWAAGYIQAAKASGLMSGYEDGSFRPDQRLTRAEAVKVINNLLKRPTPKLGKDVWKDVSQKDWFWSDVQSASESFSQTQYVDGTSSSIVLP